MRLLILTLILALVAQPLQAGGCMIMGAVQDAAQDSFMPMGDMDGDEHDCCDDGESAPTNGCEDAQCCPCLAGASPLPVFPQVIHTRPDAAGPVLMSGVTSSSHSAPPFRPPIS